MKIGTDEVHLDIIKRGYKPTWHKKAPRKNIALNPTISSKASQVLYTEVEVLLRRRVICKMAGCMDSMLVHTLEYQNLRDALTNRDQFCTIKNQ